MEILILIIFLIICWLIYFVTKKEEPKTTVKQPPKDDNIEDDIFNYPPIGTSQIKISVTAAFRNQYFINKLTDLQNLITEKHKAPIKITIKFSDNEIKEYEAIVDLKANQNDSPRIRPGIDYFGNRRNTIRQGIDRLFKLNPNLETFLLTVIDETDILIEPIFNKNFSFFDEQFKK